MKIDDVAQEQNNKSISKTIESLGERLNTSSDIHKAITEFFKDEKIDNDEEIYTHSVDLRSRLVARAVRGHAIINFLQSIKMEECGNQSLADGLGILSISMKRHVISLNGISRQELIDLFKAENLAKKPESNFSIMQPMK